MRQDLVREGVEIHGSGRSSIRILGDEWIEGPVFCFPLVECPTPTMPQSFRRRRAPDEWSVSSGGESSVQITEAPTLGLSEVTIRTA